MRRLGGLVAVLVWIAVLAVCLGLPLFMTAWWLWAVAHGLTPRPLGPGG
ncbi:hypothetical protein ABT095_34805 [Kitasatospora sp. NPDC002227]